jgi:hypothetical protein
MLHRDPPSCARAVVGQLLPFAPGFHDLKSLSAIPQLPALSSIDSHNGAPCQLQTLLLWREAARLAGRLTSHTAQVIASKHCFVTDASAGIWRGNRTCGSRAEGALNVWAGRLGEQEEIAR